ncbi:hypothetical protein MUA11_09415 [Staphylococcus agnetis]|uniref:hypothetical protein n=1 Tax=Staphylococcus agnetis TaxID=985762 RepID=UPI0021CF922F|nr:hypothetical protein [Staphylococcus agnetis]UXU54519.1 hypothetical protein MUA11_09415 [Staphylococcus agnetis]
MKEKKFIIMISSILGFVLLLFMIFEIAAIFNTNLTESSNRSLEISIALFSMFATFGGAYLGAKISATTAIKLSRIDKKIENSKNMLVTMSEINKVREKIIQKLDSNIIELGKLKEQGGHYNGELKEYEKEYKQWKSYYAEMQIYVIGTELNQNDISFLKEPSYLFPYLKDYLNRFTYNDFNGEGRSNIGIYDDELEEYEKILKDCKSKLHRLENMIENIKEKVFSQFPV